MIFDRSARRSLLLAGSALSAFTLSMGAAAQDAQDSDLDNRNIEEVVVQGQYIPDEKRATAEISNVLDETALARTGDSDIAVALQRVTGLSLVKGKFVFVRGLGERYSSALLDGASLPSPEPLQRVVPLDIFPTSLLSSALVQKTFSPKYPGEFGGGVIELRTKAIPDEQFLTIGVSGEINTASTFQDGLGYDGSGLDFLGFDTGLRSLPDGLAANPSLAGLDPTQVEAIAEELPPIFSLDREPNPANLGIDVSYGNSWDTETGRIGLTAVVSYDNKFFNRDGVRRTFAGPNLAPRLILSDEGCSQDDFPGNDGNCGFRSTEQTVGLNGILSVGWEIDDRNSLKYTTLVLRKTVIEGFNSQGQQAENGILRNNTRVDFVEQQVWTQQLGGTHEYQIFGDDAEPTLIEWRASYAKAFRDVQLRRNTRYNFDEDTGLFLLDTSDEGNRTIFGDLTDDNIELGFDITQPVFIGEVPVDIKLGFTYQDKERESDFLRYRYNFQGTTVSRELRQLVPEIIFGSANVGPGGIGFNSVTRLEDSYTAGFENTQAYLQFDAQITPEVRLSLGGRYEDSTLSTNSFNVIGAPVLGLEETGRFLPATTLTYEFAENMQVRAAYSRTLSRPDLRELSPARFLDDERDIDVRGNPNLITSTLDNFDLRWEWYFSEGQQATIGVFYKDIANPIEQVFTVVADELLLTYLNGEGGEVYGIEAEIETYLPAEDWFGSFFAERDLFFKANASYIDSDITSDTSNNQNLVTDLQHRLQGQSRYLFNSQIGWENLDTGETVALLFNYTGPRISDLGIAGAGNIIERAFYGLDFTYKRTINLGVPLQFEFKARNLLNDDLTRVQENRGGGEDQIVERYGLGRTFSVGLSYTF